VKALIQEKESVWSTACYKKSVRKVSGEGWVEIYGHGSIPHIFIIDRSLTKK
jgi:hypothetical protein